MPAFLRHVRENKSGGSMIEFALTLPVILLMALGAGDLARIFVEAAMLAGASNSGATYGYRTHKASADFEGMKAVIAEDAAEIEGVTPTADRVCDCPDNPGVWIDCTQTTCTSYGLPRVYVRAKAAKQFETMAAYPGVQRVSEMSMETLIRVQ